VREVNYFGAWKVFHEKASKTKKIWFVSYVEEKREKPREKLRVC
jgi:hypothetical protein